MKKFNKVFLILISIFVISCIININVYGEVKTTSDDGKFNYTTVSEDVTQITPSTTYIKNTGFTTRSGVDFDQVNHIFVADYKKGEDIKVVSWAVKNADNTGFAYRTIKSIGEDYERTHPGYIVLCGINSDQYYMSFGTNLLTDSTDYYRPQSVYPMVSDGDNLFLISPYGERLINNTVGFPNNGDRLVYGAREIKGFFIHVYNDKNEEIGKFEIEDLNIMDDINYNETTVISPYRITDNSYQTMTKQSDNGFFVVEKADLCYVNNTTEYAFYKGEYAVNSFFGKGAITKTTNEISLQKNQFAIETSNPTLKKLLNVGTYVKCQYEFDEGFDGIKESTGFHAVQRYGGVDWPCDAPYCLRPYPRSIVGCDSDGRVYMIVCNGKNSAPTEGMWFGESNALMKQYGIIDAFQMDGGGSVTGVIRNERGELEEVNPPVEGSYRQDLCGIYVVMKVTKAEVKVKTRTQTTATLDCNLSNVEEDYSEAYIRYGLDLESGEENRVKINNNEAIITGLTQNLSYKYQLVLKMKDGTEKYTYVKGVFDTYPNYPVVRDIDISLKGNKYIIKVRYDDEYKLLNKMTLNINGKDYNLKYNDGLGSAEIDKNVASILDIKIMMRCKPLGIIENIEATSFDILATKEVYLSHIVTSINDMVNKLYE